MTPVTPTSTITYLRPAAFVFLAVLAVFAAALTIYTATRAPTYQVFTTSDGRADSRQPVDPPTQRCTQTRTDPDGFPVWDCETIRTDPAPLMRLVCVKRDDVQGPYILCGSTRSAAGLAGKLG